MFKNLAQCYLNIQVGFYPQTSEEVADNEYDAVKIGNFKLAYQLRKTRKEKEGKEVNNTISALLEEIIDILDSKDKNQEKKAFDDLFTQVACEPEKNIEKILPKLSTYMKSIGKKEYEFLVGILIRISISRQKTGYSETFDGVFMTLGSIKNGTFHFDLVSYKECFYKAIEQNELEEAECYFAIIRAYSKEMMIEPSELDRIKNDLINAKSVHSLEMAKKNTEESLGGYYYGIEDAEQLMKAIESTNLGIKRACIQLGIGDEETINLIRLIYVKNYYSYGLHDFGHKLLQKVKESKNKSQKLRRAIQDIEENHILHAHERSYLNIGPIKLLKP